MSTPDLTSDNSNRSKQPSDSADDISKGQSILSEEETESEYFAVPAKENLLPGLRFRGNGRNGGASQTQSPPALSQTDAEAIIRDSLHRENRNIESVTPQPSSKLASRHFKSLSHRGLRNVVKDAPGDIVEGLIPEDSLNIAVGDSGLGKTPLLVQLGVCVATGKPFLCQDVRQGAVLWVDYENGLSGLDDLLSTIGLHLKLNEIPDTFRIFSHPATHADIVSEIRLLRPVLVIVDALRGFDPSAEKDNTAAGRMLENWHRICQEFRVALILIHHVRKPAVDNPQFLATEDSPLTWLLQASGARALINQTTVRIGIDRHSVPPTELILRGHYKLRGEIGPWLVARKYDDAGEPTGYYRLTGVELLPPDQRQAFERLPDEFTFTQAETTYGKKGGKPTTVFLKRCVDAGILKKSGRLKQTRYRKSDAPEK